jgi:DNA-binding winged helix-turn-helix (wHTH) protein
MSKHAQRRARRAKHLEMLRSELSDERAFTKRVIATINNRGLDWAPDGRPIKADFFGAIHAWKQADEPASLACLDLVERAVAQIQVKPVAKR